MYVKFIFTWIAKRFGLECFCISLKKNILFEIFALLHYIFRFCETGSVCMKLCGADIVQNCVDFKNNFFRAMQKHSNPRCFAIHVKVNFRPKIVSGRSVEKGEDTHIIIHCLKVHVPLMERSSLGCLFSACVFSVGLFVLRLCLKFTLSTMLFSFFSLSISEYIFF